MLNENDGVLLFNYSTFVEVSQLLKTSDKGNSWNNFGNGFEFLFGVSDFELISEDTGYVCTNNRFLFRTTNSGLMCDTLQTGLNLQEAINNFEFFNSNVSYGINHNHIYKTTDGWITYSIIDSLLTNINDKSNAPMKFTVEQNYPNPFNPSTVIKYQIPIASQVTLMVYDILGNEIEVLINEEKPEGNYSNSFTPNSTLSSGIYFYQLKAGSFTQTKKMLLIK